MNESVMRITDTIIDALKEDTTQLRKKCEVLVKKLTEEFLAIILSDLQGEIILKFRAFLHKSLMKNRKFKEKVVEVFSE